MTKREAALSGFHEPVQVWFQSTFGAPTLAQKKGWPPILAGKNTLLLAPTGSGKTLAAFLAAIDRLMFSAEPPKKERCRVLYISPLKALGADVERNLRMPILGIAEAAVRLGVPHRVPMVAVRSGDTPANERARAVRSPPDILITTPESLYLILTSAARDMLRSVETVIVDEIHSVVGTKRGAHLSLSLERLEQIREGCPLTRIGLSATQRPLAEVARFLGGNNIGIRSEVWPREVEIVDAGAKKVWDLLVTVPVDNMARPDEGAGPQGSVVMSNEAAVPQGSVVMSGEGAAPEGLAGPSAETTGSGQALPTKSIWPKIHPKLVELIRAHTSTMIFVNSRRLSERLAAALNDLAGEEIALAHHGSLAKEKRREIEERLKAGQLPAIIATSSLELGIDIGALDLVIQIEAPPSIASGLQRIGRAGHSVGATSRGVIFPKYRGDLLACAAATKSMVLGLVEATYYLRNPLDVLAQQVVASISIEPMTVDELYALVRRSACFAELPRNSLEGVLDMLSGKYPSDEFAELRPRLTWDRTNGKLRARETAKRIAIVNGGTIPDRGLYGVYLSQDRGGDEPSAKAHRKSFRVGELDEEMVFESRVGEVFLLGASSWRIDEITHDRVLVSPAPGQPGKMPFWHGDRPGRPAELGRTIGVLARTLSELPFPKALEMLQTEHGLDEKAAKNLCAYVAEQVAATGHVPSDRTITVERYIDDIGTYCVCILSPFGARVHAPWAQIVMTRLNASRDQKVEAIWSDDGIVFRLPDSENPPDQGQFLPSPEIVEDTLVLGLGQTSLFAARFRENAGRALLLPRRRPGERTPLWAQRKRSHDLLAVAAKYPSFPILLETYRECLRDVLDVPSLIEILTQIKAGKIKIRTVDSRTPSPFAASLLFSYVANFLYEGDTPLAERRAQALSVDPSQLRELLGEAELRELLDADVIFETEQSLQRLDGKRLAYSADSLHDMLLGLGDLSKDEIAMRSEPGAKSNEWTAELLRDGRALRVTIANEARFIAIEDVARYRDALAIVLPKGLPAAFLAPLADALGDLVSRYARTHGPFLLENLAKRYALGVSVIHQTLQIWVDAGRFVEGDLLPRSLLLGGPTQSETPRSNFREYCDVEVLRTLKRKSLAKLRKLVEPVSPAAFARFLLDFHGVTSRSRGPDALAFAIEKLEGAPLPISALEAEILPQRVDRFRSGDLDLLCATGEVVWVGIEPLGQTDGRIGLYLSSHVALLAPPPKPAEGELAGRLRALLAARGASFFSDLLALTGVFSQDLMTALWELVWAGEVTNDTLAPLRSLQSGVDEVSSKRAAFQSRRMGMRPRGPKGSEGRWSLLAHAREGAVRPSDTERLAALARNLLDRHGVLLREAALAEGLPSGFSAVYSVLKMMEDAGKVRRGYFVKGMGATQFAMSGAEERLRAMREPSDTPQWIVLSAVDPANPYGAALPWPERPDGGRPSRTPLSQVVLLDGELIGYLGRTDKSVLTFFPKGEAARERACQSLARALADLVESGRKRTLLIEQVDGVKTVESAMAAALKEVGFTPMERGFFKRSPPPGFRALGGTSGGALGGTSGLR